ncbi:hypothetical protein LOTGIDRAFT_175126 [Lottia gigantea]|uniref:Uncharacterized protein n=1 Tax=Lottia gigantea TaxID=225164 RepID=V3ZVQ0_LOTGI|nr:hypothetical protein LOTGIDRAFT_175126 [Lottia gigantea]ESO95593.1 hypothetical protein LOTGIDRAFT_175126 [Lottia gigantea]
MVPVNSKNNRIPIEALFAEIAVKLEVHRHGAVVSGYIHCGGRCGGRGVVEQGGGEGKNEGEEGVKEEDSGLDRRCGARGEVEQGGSEGKNEGEEGVKEEDSGLDRRCGARGEVEEAGGGEGKNGGEEGGEEEEDSDLD